ncbi:trifunctional serine/threonine-protein kinase/ATP-binding protein/sensor histidine kinase [Aerosakkonema funiforme]|uniref:trifunctional serine/threonine-protein kinase/ATP-binding protein/sensor histidine kinase n=1 Tax=Aerosakkonema funiforme TaxID=1246630 RepID=UPI0035B9D20C
MSINNPLNTTANLTNYQITELIYSGSRTLVYRAIRTDDNLPVVIKVMKRQYPTFSELVQFRNQYTIAKSLEIPGIIKPYSLEPYQNGYGLVMEDFGGISLQQFCGQKALKLEQFILIAIQITDVLEHLHQHNVIHKDIKPANILINPQTNQIKIIDFSIASLLPKENQEIQNPNVLEGTLAYLSPEQTGRMNRGIDYRSDFYSLGVTFYELLTGQLPFSSQDPMELVHCHIAKEPSFLEDKRKEIPQIVVEIVMKLMAKNAEDRYQSALGLKQDLEICLKQWQESKNIPAFKLRERDISARFVIPEKLYGRQAEVQALLDAFDRVAGIKESQLEIENFQHQSELILVTGFSGIGKTAVVNEVHKPIVRQRGYFIKGKFDQFNRNIPFSAFVQAFRDLMGQLLSETDRQLEKWKTKILAALGENAQVIIEVIPELDRIIGKQLPVPELSGIAAQNRFNLLLQKFLQVFTTKEHPLVIFIDDLQWADSASLHLIKMLMSETKNPYLLLIGAYRDNEVTLAHPLISTLTEIQKFNAKVTTINLDNLDELSVNQLVADTLSCSLELALPLSELVIKKTKGNPFFINQFMKSMYEDKLIALNLERNCWECDLTKVRTLAITDDVVEFMARQIEKLPVDTQNILKLAACIGNYFNLATLAIVSEKSEMETAADLWKALQEGLILPISNIYKFYQQESLVNGNVAAEKADSTPGLSTIDRQGEITVTYKFLHDRVQQAAYSLIADSQKQATHLKIGQLLLQNCSEIEREEKLFDIVGHLNIGKELIDRPNELENLAKLNLAAGCKARNSTAHVATRIYLQTGIELLTANCWQTQYELTFDLYVAATEAAYLNGDFDGMERLVEIALQQAKTILDGVKIYEILIVAQTARGKILEAIAIGRKALGLLGVELCAEPNQTSIDKALQTIVTQLQGRQIEELVDLPVMTDANAQAALQLLATLFAPIFVGMPGLLPFLSATMVSLSLQFGNAPKSSVGYAIHGLVLCTFLEEVETGYAFGKLALNLMERFDVRELNSAILAFFGSFIQHRRETLSATLSTLKDSYTAGMETGDLLQAGYSIISYFHHSLLSGKELNVWEAEIPAYSAVLNRSKQYSAQIYLSILWQTVRNLREIVSQPNCLIGNTYDETVMLPKHVEDNELTAIAIIYIYKLLLAYSFDRYSDALDCLVRIKPYLMAVSGLVFVPVFHFYAALTQLAKFSTQPEMKLSEMLAEVEIHQTTLHRWAQNAPMNHLHKWYLVEAEKHRVLDEKIAAIECYDKAISLAREHQFINEEALANELAAKFYLGWGKEKVAQGYMQEAYYCYARWGAKGKVVDLEQRYPKLLVPILHQVRSPFTPYETITVANTIGSSQSSTDRSIASTNRGVLSALDLTTILKASQTLSSEIELEKLLSTLLHMAIENAGADKCALLLQKEGKLLIEAMMSLGGKASLLRSLPLEDSQEVPISLINTVKRTLQPTAIANVIEHPLLLADPYIIRQQPKSLLCMPFLHQSKLLGVLYLENKLATGAFTSDRVEVLHLICAQAAISLENARLYQQSQTYGKQLEQSLEKLHLSEARFQKLTDNIPGMIYQLRLAADGSVSIPYVSSGCYHLYEVTAEEMVGGKYSLRSMEHPDDRADIERGMMQSAQNFTPFLHEWRIIAKSGKIKWVQGRSQPERQADGSILWDGILVDISDRKLAEVQLQQKAKELENALQELQQAQIHLIQSEKMSALGNLVSGVAHEINNPVGFLSGNIPSVLDYIKDVFGLLDLYQRKYDDRDSEIQALIDAIDLDYIREDLPKSISSMQEGVNRIREISTSLRIFSRADKNYKVPFNIHDGIDSTILILKHRLKASDLHPAIEIIKEYGNLPQIQCFPGQLNQVFMNILGNAIDALEEANQGRSFAEIQASPNRITIRTAIIPNNCVMVRIADNGIGMTPEVKRQIFDHLFTTKAVGKGTGLGLAIAKSIVVEKHGGSIDCYSQPGKGTEFIIYLPIKTKNTL